MEQIIIYGGNPLEGTVTVSGAKNAVLPIIAASLLAEGESTLLDIPQLADVTIISQLIRQLGANVEDNLAGTVKIDASYIKEWEAPYEYVRKMRASFLLMGPLLARLGKARIPLPGGCAIGSRPIDLHLKGFEAMGAKIFIGHGYVEATASKLTGSKVYMDFPSVGATENIMMAAALAEGQTVIENAAEEPEIVDLANFINNMGGRVKGAGTKIVRIEGVAKMHGTTHAVIPDRIEAGSFMVAAAATGGNVLLENVIIDHLKPVVAKLKETGTTVLEEEDGVRVIGIQQLKSVDIKTMPYPGFPTDMQAQMMALLTRAKGTSIITESVFENRFMHVDELKRMGAEIKIEGRSAIVEGVNSLTGTQVKATDLRAGAAMVIAALTSVGRTEIGCVHHIDRGYDNIVQKFQELGARIERAEI
ncbi:MAG: UDP-N-acetylglucosamine 1-carboxyvinyltransferase [Clostridia bacterium]|nr:UDP-N-acetylglucosamine 1-carboxyvinyltransferase [Clostridia bacterium]